jgi:protein SCO1/2
MWAKSVPLMLLSAVLQLPTDPARAASSTHPPSGHDRSAAAGGFDSQAALRLSQAALGKTLGDHALRRGDGATVRLSDYRGRPLVVSLVYTGCYHICPTTTQHLAKVVRVARAALGDESFHVLTIGFDTAKDTPPAMQAFAQGQNANISGWEFLSADGATIERLTQDLGFVYFRTPKGFDHLIQATVIDGAGKIYRQVYGMNFDTPLLVEPLKELVFGAPARATFMENLSQRIKLFCTVYDPANDRYRFDYSIFVGLFIGLSSLGVLSFLLVREWRKTRNAGRA